jgi:WD40 repeat protein
MEFSRYGVRSILKYNLPVLDVKSNQVVRTMSPLTGENDVSNGISIKLQKPSWISAIAIDETEKWMAVGGGACYATLWYLPQMTLTAVMPTSATINDICFTNEQIITVGNERNITFWDKSGKFRTRATTNNAAIFNVSRISGLSTVSSCRILFLNN